MPLFMPDIRDKISRFWVVSEAVADKRRVPSLIVGEHETPWRTLCGREV